METRIKKIHVVDDDRVVCHSLKQILRKYGFDVEVYNSAEEYLSDLIEGYDGYLLLDHKMSGMSGLELQEVLSSKNVSPSIIFISAMSDQIRERALANGALHVFEKPFDPTILIDVLKDTQH